MDTCKQIRYASYKEGGKKLLCVNKTGFLHLSVFSYLKQDSYLCFFFFVYFSLLNVRLKILFCLRKLNNEKGGLRSF